MARELTDGFPLAAQIAEAVVDRVFANTLLGRLPTLTAAPSGRAIQVWFDRPTTTLVPGPNPLQNIVQVSLPMTARLADRGDESSATLVVRPSLSQVEVEHGGRKLLAPMVDFRALGTQSFEVVGAVPEYVEPLRAVLVETLKARSPIIGGPLLPDPGRQVFFRTYTVAAATSQADVLAVFVDDGSGAALPAHVTARCGDRVVALVPDDLVRQRMDAGLAARGLANLPAPMPGQEDYTLHRLGIELRTGHVYVSGRAEGSWGPFSGSVDFEAWLQLWAEGQRIEVNVLRTKTDADALLDFADFFSAGAITRMLEEELPKAVGSIGGGAFGSMALFTDDVPASAAFAAARAFGSVLVLPIGLGIPLDLTSTAAPARVDPPYLRGHEESREFHVSHGCAFGDLIASRNLRRFPTWQRAVALGYNGCTTCSPEFNVTAEGRLVVRLTTPNDGQNRPVPRISAEFNDNVVRFGVAVHPLREEIRAGRGFIDEAGQVAFSTSRWGLVPGEWSVTVTWGDWTVTQTVRVERAWTNAQGQAQGLRTFLEARRGDPQLAIRYE